MKCDKCRGKGFKKVKETVDCVYINVCAKCKGYGELDWLERICGSSREEKDIYDFKIQMETIIKKKSKDVDIYCIDRSEGWVYPYFQFEKGGKKIAKGVA